MNWNDPAQVVIRTRVSDGLERLLERVQKLELAEVIRDDIGTDYAYRIFGEKKLWIDYLLEAGKKLNYHNFKNVALPNQHGSGRSSAYHKVWNIMRNWQDNESGK
jgi:hypothetical protein